MCSKTLACLTVILIAGVTVAQSGWTVLSTCGRNGTITPVGVVRPGGGSSSFTVTADPAYHIAEVYTNGIPCGFLAAQNVTQTVADVSLGVLSDHATIHAEFSRDEVSDYALVPTPASPSIIPVLFCIDMSNLWGYAACGTMPVDNSNLWSTALSDGWTWPPLGGAMPVQSDSAGLVVAYPPLMRPPAPLDLHVAALPGGNTFDLYWRFDDSHSEAREALLEYRDLDASNAVFTTAGLIAYDKPFTNALSLHPGKRYTFRIAAKGNGYFSDYSPPFVLSTYVTNSPPHQPVLSPVVNVVTVRADIAGLNWPVAGAAAVIYGSQSGARSATASPSNAGQAFTVPTHEFFPGEEAWVVVTAQTNGPHATAATPHAWRTVGNVRFGGGEGYVLASLPNTGFDKAVLSDINSDGFLDILASTRQQIGDWTIYSIVCWTNTGTSAFAQADSWTFDTEQVSAISVADMDHSGCNQLLVASGNTLSVFNPSSLSAGPTYQIQFTSAVTAVQPADLDLDGDIDLVVGCNGPNAVLLNNGTGHFHMSPQDPWEPSKTLSIAVGDLNRDGYPDIVCGNEGVAQSSVWFGSGNGLLQLAQTNWPGWSTVTSLRAVAVADIDGNGADDIVIAGDAGGGSVPSNRYWLNDGNGKFTSSTEYSTESISCLTIADVEGNETARTPSIISGSKDNQKVSFWQLGQAVKNQQWVMSATSLCAGDMDGNGTVDLLFCGGDNASIYLNQPPPPAVKELSLMNLSNTNFSLAWTACPPPVTNYEVRITPVDPLGSAFSVLTGTGTNTSIACTLGWKYECQVRGTNAYGAGPWTEPPLTVTAGLYYDEVLVSWLKLHYPYDPISLYLLDSDTDGDGYSTRQEYIANTDPTSAASRFLILNLDATSLMSQLSWQGASNRIYTLQYSGGLTPPSWSDLAETNGIAGINSMTVAPTPPSGFYRLRVRIAE